MTENQKAWHLRQQGKSYREIGRILFANEIDESICTNCTRKSCKWLLNKTAVWDEAEIKIRRQKGKRPVPMYTVKRCRRQVTA